jgi:hypothetical protein
MAGAIAGAVVPQSKGNLPATCPTWEAPCQPGQVDVYISAPSIAIWQTIPAIDLRSDDNDKHLPIGERHCVPAVRPPAGKFISEPIDAGEHVAIGKPMSVRELEVWEVSQNALVVCSLLMLAISHAQGVHLYIDQYAQAFQTTPRRIPVAPR